MTYKTVRRLSTAMVFTSAAALAVGSNAQSNTERANKNAPRSEAAQHAEEDSAAERADGLSPQDREMAAWANELAREITGVIEKWLSSGSVSEEKLFSHLYYPIPDSEPTKFNSDYDALSDRDFPGVQEKYFGKAPTILYAIAEDSNGYVPTHNRQFSQPLTGNPAVNLVNNRTKRIFGDATGFAAARNLSPRLLQTYKRDTGELVADLSVPITIRGKHWGCARVGYRKVEK